MRYQRVRKRRRQRRQLRHGGEFRRRRHFRDRRRLGATYALDGFRYVPRQDGSHHGMVATWQFYASTDQTNWGTAVSSGTFNADTSEERVMFTRTTARYVRFVALSEINGNPWASVAELRMVGGAN